MYLCIILGCAGSLAGTLTSLVVAGRLGAALAAVSLFFAAVAALLLGSPGSTARNSCSCGNKLSCMCDLPRPETQPSSLTIRRPVLYHRSHQGSPYFYKNLIKNFKKIFCYLKVLEIQDENC